MLETLFSPQIIVPILVAFIGALVAITTTIIAKENKISEFRQAWIDALREDLAQFYAINNGLILLNYKQEVNYQTTINDIHKNMLNFDTFLARITLRLNLHEHSELKEQIDAISKWREDNAKKPEKYKDLEELQKHFLDLSNNLLAIEWRVVKKGEVIFREFKHFGKALLLATCILIIIA